MLAPKMVHCQLCNGTPEEGIITPCKHIFCKSCFLEWRKTSLQCPLKCSELLKSTDLRVWDESRTHLLAESTSEVTKIGSPQKPKNIGELLLTSAKVMTLQEDILRNFSSSLRTIDTFIAEEQLRNGSNSSAIASLRGAASQLEGNIVEFQNLRQRLVDQLSPMQQQQLRDMSPPEKSKLDIERRSEERKRIFAKSPETSRTSCVYSRNSA